MTKFRGIFSFVIYLFVSNHYVKCDENALTMLATTNTESMLNPHSLYYNRNEERIMTKEDFDMIQRDENFFKDKSRAMDDRRIQDCMQAEIFYKRLIKLLLSNTDLKEDGNFIEGILKIEATTDQIETLQDFGNSQVSLREIDTILSEIIKKPRYNILHEVVHLTEKIFWIMREYKEVVLASIVAILSILTLRNLRWTPGVIILFTVLAAFLISFAITYMHLIQEAEIKLAAARIKFSTIPSACLPEKMYWYEKMASFFYTNNDCEKYFKATMTDTKLQVTPALVLSHLFSTIIFHPFSVFGTAVSNFVENSTEDLPALIRWPLIYLIFFSICILIITLPLCLIGGSFSVALGPLFKVSLSGSSRKDRSLENLKRQERIEYIREVPYDTSKDTKKAITHDHDHRCYAVKAPQSADSCKSNVKNELNLTDFTTDSDKASGDASANNIASRISEVVDKDFEDCVRKQDEQEVGSGDG